MVAVAVAAWAGGAGSAAAADRDDGRRYAERANQLAAAGKCRQAIPLFGKAYDLLSDPALLFNRAECHRKLGEKNRALVDYQRFLIELPDAPNRAAAEKRVVELGGRPFDRTPPPRPRPTPAPRSSPPPPTPTPTPTSSPTNTKTDSPTSTSSPTNAKTDSPTSTSPGTSTKSTTNTTPTTIAAADSSSNRTSSAPLAPPPPSPQDRSTTALDLTDHPGHDHHDRGVPGWVWIGVGAAVLIGGVFGTYLFWTRGRTDVPPTALGNYEF